MNLNNFIEAIADQLKSIWPDKLVYVDEMPNEADGNFFAGVIESSQESKLDRRRRRSLQFEVLYFLRSDETMAFNEWAEAMYDNFESLIVQENEDATRLVWISNAHARRDDNAMVFQFLFDIDFYFVIAPETLPTMETLEIKEEING